MKISKSKIFIIATVVAIIGLCYYSSITPSVSGNSSSSIIYFGEDTTTTDSLSIAFTRSAEDTVISDTSSLIRLVFVSNDTIESDTAAFNPALRILAFSNDTTVTDTLGISQLFASL